MAATPLVSAVDAASGAPSAAAAGAPSSGLQLAIQQRLRATKETHTSWHVSWRPRPCRMGSCSSNRGQRGDPSAAVALTAASGASMIDDEMIDDMDVDSRILQSRTQRSIHDLPEEVKEELRSYRALEGEGHEFQRKWTDFHWPRHGEHQASGGDFLEMIPGLDPATLEAKRTEIQRNLPGFCNPCLEPMAIRDGIKHHGDKKEDKVAEVEKHNLHKQYDLSEFGETAPSSSSPASGGLPASSSPAPGGLHPPLKPPMAVD